MIGGILFVPSVYLRYNFRTLRDRYFIFGMHTPLIIPYAYSTNYSLSSDTKVNNLVTSILTSKLKIAFYAPRSNDMGHIVFVLSVCLFVCLSVCLFVRLSVVNFNLHYNFWTVRDRDFIFGMHTPLMMSFQMTPRSMTLWPWLWPWS